jgi:hypothetical protein
MELSAASAGTFCRKLVDWIVCDECRDGEVKNSGNLRGKHGDGSVKSLWIVLRRVQGQDVGNSGYFSGKCWGGKVRNLCLDTEMSDRIFSGSKSQRTVWDAGETRLQGGEMQRSSGSTGLFEAVSSSSSSVGVMRVEDT